MRPTAPRRRPARRALTAVLSTLGLAAASAAAVALPATASAPPPPAGWTTVFTDDFNGPAGSGLNTANWQYTPAPATPAARPTSAPARSRR